jgi:protein SCO1
MLRKFIFIICFVLAAGLSPALLRGQGNIPPEVGIVENLGDTIPLNLSFMDETGQAIQLRQLINRPTILVVIYFACPGICPMMLSGVSDMIERSDMTLGKEFSIITVSMNENDTPAEAAKKKQSYLRKKSLPFAKDWVYLTGDSASIHALTNSIGYYFKRTGNDLMHPAAIMILSPEGKITRYLYGTSFLPFDVKMAIVEAQKGLPRPTINRVLEYCFNYDPEGRKYTLQVTKITATVIIFFAVILFIFLLIRSRREKGKSADPALKS